jgi:fluoroquinolone resistance protein
MSSFSDLDLKNLNFNNCKIFDCDFFNTNLTKANFEDSDLKKSRFQNSNLSFASFKNAKNYNINPNQNKFLKTKFSLPEAISLLDNFNIELI